MMNTMNDKVKVSSNFIIQDVLLTVKNKSVKKVLTKRKAKNSNEKNDQQEQIMSVGPVSVEEVVEDDYCWED